MRYTEEIKRFTCEVLLHAEGGFTQMRPLGRSHRCVFGSERSLAVAWLPHNKLLVTYFKLDDTLKQQANLNIDSQSLQRLFGLIIVFYANICLSD